MNNILIKILISILVFDSWFCFSNDLIQSLNFDAEQTEHNLQQNKIFFSGDVAIISDRFLISADTITWNRNTNNIQALGHVFLISGNQLMICQALDLSSDTLLFRAESGSFLLNDQILLQKYLSLILGSNSLDLIENSNRTGFLKDIYEEKKALFKQLQGDNVSSQDRQIIIEKYALLLKRESLLLKQDTLSSNLVRREQSSKLKRRRQIWNSLQKQAKNINSPKISGDSFLRIDADEIIRLDKEKFLIRNSNITSCKCSENEEPDWSFSSSKIKLEKEEFADIYHSTFNIKGVPLLYFPYFKIPIKTKPHPGLLFPNIITNKKEGFIYSQEMFLPYNDFFDQTYKVTWFNKRGILFGLENRYVDSDSFFILSVDGIKDKKWESKNIERNYLSKRYKEGLKAAYLSETQNRDIVVRDPVVHDLNSPNWWKKNNPNCLTESGYNLCLNNKIDEYIKGVERPFRGQLKVKAYKQISSDVSFYLNSKFVTDHRYIEDLEYLNINDFLKSNYSRDLFNYSSLKFNLYRTDYSFTLGSMFSDQINLSQLFSGYQMPFYFNARTRFFSLFDVSYPLIYMNTEFLFKNIYWNGPEYLNQTLSNKTLDLRLHNGLIEDLSLNTLSPVFLDQIFNLVIYNKLQVKAFHTSYRANQYLSDQDEEFDFLKKKSFSLFGSNTSGIKFSLPVEGVFVFNEKIEQIDSIRKRVIVPHLKHEIDAEIDFSYREQIYNRGDYGKYTQQLAKNNLDQWVNDVNSDFLSYFNHYEDLMFSQKKISFSLRNKFSMFSKVKSLYTKVIESNNKNKDYFFQKAKNELLPSEQKKHQKLYTEETINDLSFPVDLNFNIFYDLSEKNIYKKNKDRWSPLESYLKINLYPFFMEYKHYYDFYLLRTKKQENKMSAILPYSLKLTYSIINTFENSSIMNYEKTVISSYGLSFSYFKNISLSYLFSDKKIKSNSLYYHKVSFDFLPRSECWGINFIWNKDFTQKVSEGTFYLGVFIKFNEKETKIDNLLSRFN